MKFLFFSILLCMIVQTEIRADDLEDAKTPLTVEPKYESEQPGYLLVVFGQETLKPVWIVSDINAIYIDRNSNGDITEADEKIEATEIVAMDSPKAMFREYRLYRLGDIAESGKHPAYHKVTISQSRNATDHFPDATAEQKALKQTLVQLPHFFGSISVKVGDFEQNAGPGFAKTQGDAPIVHFDGPLSLSFADRGKTQPPEVDPESGVFPYKFRLGTPGSGKASFAYTKAPIQPTMRAVLKDDESKETNGKVDLIFCGSDYCTTIELPTGRKTEFISILISVPPFAGRVVKPLETDVKMRWPEPDKK